MPERKVGEIFEFKGMTLKCELSPNNKCDHCRLSDMDCLGDYVGPCVPQYRQRSAVCHLHRGRMMWTSWTCPKCEKNNVEEITLPQPPKIVECEHCSERQVMFVTIEIKTELYPCIEDSDQD